MRLSHADYIESSELWPDFKLICCLFLPGLISKFNVRDRKLHDSIFLANFRELEIGINSEYMNADAKRCELNVI